MGTTVQKLQRILETKTGFKNLITEKGGVITETTTFHEYIDEVRKLMEAGASGEAIEIATEEELDAAMVEENIGKFYKYTGESTVKYEKDAVYVVQDADNPIIEDEIKSITTEVEMDAALVEENIGKFFLYTGETCDKYMNNMIYVVQDKDNPIIDSPAIIEGGATGTAIPNSGFVEKIYINKNMSPDDVDALLENTFIDYSWEDTLGTYALAYNKSDNGEKGITMGSMQGRNHKDFMIMDGSTGDLIYVSPELASEFGTPVSGWNQDYTDVYEFNAEIQSTEKGPTDNYNEALKQIFSITPFDGESFRKELKGTYEPVTVEVTENGETDLTTYMDEQKMPIKVNVNVEESGGGVELKAEETRSAVPTSGYIDKVYFNTELTVAEIDEIIANADIPWSYNGMGEVIFVTEDMSMNIMLMNMAFQGIAGYMIVNMQTTEFLYISQDLYDTEPGACPFVGWNPAYITGYKVQANVLPELIDGSSSLKIGTCNEILKDVMYVSSGFNYYKELSGEYEAVSIDITNNQSIEFDSYYLNKKIPVKLNVNVASSGSLKALLDHTKSTSYMFSNWKNITEFTNDHISFDATSNVTDMSNMFYNCDKLTNIPLFDTSNVTNFSRAFYGCSSLTEVPEFDLHNVTNLEYAFNECSSLMAIPEFDTSNVVNFQGAFYGCSSLKEIILLNLEHATNMEFLVKDCTNLEKVILGGLSPMVSTSDMFQHCTNLTDIVVTNICNNLQIGLGSAWGTKITLDSLIGICKECVRGYDINNPEYKHKLKMSDSSLEKLADVYVKFTDPSVTEIPIGEKGDVVVCEPTDEGAMTILDYMDLKYWTILTS